MTFTIGTLLAVSFVASLLAIAALIWAISSGQFDISQKDASVIFEQDPSTAINPEEEARLDPAWRRLLLTMFISATVWLVLGSIFGLIASFKMHLPDWLTNSAPLTFGRLRTMHLNSVIYGFLSVGGIGVAMWLGPVIFKTTLRWPKVAMSGAILWNLCVAVGVTAIAYGWTDGLEWLEIPWQIDIGLGIAGALMASSLLTTAARRKVEHIYVSNWYYMAALLWFPVLFIVANIPYLHVGSQQATVNWWFAHNVLGLWLTPLGLGAAYYFIPKIIGKPVYSYRLSLLGFWALALFYSQVGMHHLIGGPVPTWVVSLSVVQSVMMIVPVIAVAINQHVLSLSNFWAWKQSIPLRFIALGAIMYTLASLQGSIQAIRAFNTVVHFTHYTVGHAHLGAYAFVAWVLFGAIYYLLPRLTDRDWPSLTLISVHFWLVVVGFAIYFVSLSVGGWFQGMAMLDPARDFLDSMQLTIPYLTGRSVGGSLMTLGHLVFAYNLLAFFLSKPTRVPTSTSSAVSASTQ